MNVKTLSHKERNFTQLKFLIPYIISGAIPAVLFTLIRLLLLASAGQRIFIFLPFITLPFLVFAGISYYFFITHSCVFTITNPFIIYTLSSAYSFCSYTIFQESGITSLLLFAFFPIVFFFFEQMITEKKFLPFSIACAIMLCIHPEAGLQIALLLFVLAILALLYYHKFKLGNLIHIVLLFLFHLDWQMYEWYSIWFHSMRNIMIILIMDFLFPIILLYL